MKINFESTPGDFQTPSFAVRRLLSSLAAIPLPRPKSSLLCSVLTFNASYVFTPISVAGVLGVPILALDHCSSLWISCLCEVSGGLLPCTVPKAKTLKLSSPARSPSIHLKFVDRHSPEPPWTSLISTRG